MTLKKRVRRLELERRPVPVSRRVYDDALARTFARSERRMLSLCRKHGLNVEYAPELQQSETLLDRILDEDSPQREREDLQVELVWLEARGNKAGSAVGWRIEDLRRLLAGQETLTKQHLGSWHPAVAPVSARRQR
jgi:hypothetical protein